MKVPPRLGGFRDRMAVVNSDSPSPARRIVRHPTLRFLVSFPIACFSGALATDITYVGTADMIWADFSAWLLAAGLFMGVLAGIAGLIDVLANRRLRAPRQSWLLVIGGLLVLVFGFFDNLVHSRDAWTSVVPDGVALSAVTVAVMLITVWFGSATVYRRGVGAGYSGVRQ